MGVPDELAHASIRFGPGRFNTEEEVQYTIDEFTRVVRRLRALNPMCELAQAQG
jgi:cysteine desulfurase